MKMHITPISKAALDLSATSLICEYEYRKSMIFEPPIPIDEIAEKLLKLSINLDDLQLRFLRGAKSVQRVAGCEVKVLGSINQDGSVFIDETLDPVEFPNREIDYRETLAHEIGHWLNHRNLISYDAPFEKSLDLLGAQSFSRHSNKTLRLIENEADFFAYCLLVPQRLIFETWNLLFPDRKPRVLQPKTPIEHSFVEIPKYGFQLSGQMLDCETDDEALERFCKPLAERFLVSPIAMRIRLEKLGLLHRTVPLQRLLAGD